MTTSATPGAAMPPGRRAVTGRRDTVNAEQWPPEVAHLPVCPHRELPIPFIAEVGTDGSGHFTILDERRKQECLEHRLCAMCGLRMDKEIAFLGDPVSLEADGFWIEPPVHERCAELAVGGLCPYMSRERVPRRPPDDDVALIGLNPDELADVGRAAPKRPAVIAIARSYAVGLAQTHTGSLTMVYQATQVVRVRRYAWGSRGTLAEVVPAPARPVPVVRDQPRRRSRSQRRTAVRGK